MRMNGDIGIGLILLGIEAIFFVLSLDFINPDAARWPQGILFVAAIFSVLLIIHGIKEKPSYQGPQYKSVKAPLLALLIMIIYGVAMEISGFFISTLIFCPLGMFLLGQRDWKILAGVPIGLDIFVYVLFVMQLQLQMP